MRLISGFLEHCAASPGHIAFTEAGQSITYAQFNSMRQGIAAMLQQRRCANGPIAILLDRGIAAAAAIYGVLSANASYLPLDIKNPPNRINFIVKDAQPQFILGQGLCPDWLEMPEKWLDLRAIPEDAKFTPGAIDPESIAAVLYTSGSTGTPKGVALSHRALCNFSGWAKTAFALTEHDRIASLAPFHFDLSIFDLFSSLASGASVHFMPARLCLAPARLTHWLREQAISCWYTVPSLLGFIALKGGLAGTTLASLRTLLFAGEVFQTPRLIQLVEQLPRVKFYNLYGPTETNVCCYWPVEAGRLEAELAIPIGIPACNASLSIDQRSGELLVNGPNNFSGYWRQGALHPVTLNSNYATGDKVSINAHGEYCYHGRLDRMLKCSGFRVEPAEIESIISQSPAVNQCAVVGVNDITSGQRPAAVVVLKEQRSLAELLPALKSKLPDYMQPAKFLVLPSLPRLSNGKIDYPSIQTLFENT